MLVKSLRPVGVFQREGYVAGDGRDELEVCNTMLLHIKDGDAGTELLPVGHMPARIVDSDAEGDEFICGEATCGIAGS